MAIPLAALAFAGDLREHEAILRRWFFSRAFSLRFDVAANTRVVEDFDELREAMRDATLSSRPASGDAILAATRRSSGALWRAFMCAIAVNRGRDLAGEELVHLAERANTDIVVAPFFAWGDVEDSEIFPRVLNQVLATRSTARTLRNTGGEDFPPVLPVRRLDHWRWNRSFFLPILSHSPWKQ